MTLDNEFTRTISINTQGEIFSVVDKTKHRDLIMLFEDIKGTNKEMRSFTAAPGKGEERGDKEYSSPKALA